METVTLDKEHDLVYFTCPWCEMMIEVHLSQLNCKIFRCGTYKDTLKQIDPHLSKIDCERLVENGKVYGCSRPFRYVDSDPPKVEKCDYI